MSSDVNITNLSIDLVLQSIPGSDGTHWAIAEKTIVKFDNFSIRMKNYFLNELVKLIRDLIDKITQNKLILFFEKAFDAKVTTL